MGFGPIPDRTYADPKAVWKDVGSGRLNPLVDVAAGRFGPNVLVNFRVLKHGAVGHLGVFLRPLQRLGVG